jgi:hypothetical protein
VEGVAFLLLRPREMTRQPYSFMETAAVMVFVSMHV